MDWGIDIAKRLIWPLILILILIFIGMQLNGLSLETGVSPEYVNFYKDILNLAGWGILAVLVLNIYRESRIGEILELGRISKAIIFFGFFGLILIMTIGAGQIIPVPKASVQALQLSPETEIYTSSIIPAFTEDAMYLILLPIIILTVILMIAEYGLGLEITRTIAIIAVIISCLISATGFNIWFVPGFTAAHVPVYGEHQEAYLGAWVFGFGQSMVYMTTGIWAPVAHFTHNFLIAVGDLYQINIGQWQVLG